MVKPYCHRCEGTGQICKAGSNFVFACPNCYRKETATVETTKTTATTTVVGVVVEPGKPIELKDVRPEDSVLMVRTFTNGYEQTAKGVVMCVHDGHVRLNLPRGDYMSWRIYSGEGFTTKLYLLHRPPQRREITKQELIESVPIGTRVTLVLMAGDEPHKTGELTAIYRDRMGVGVRIEYDTDGGRWSAVEYVADIKTAYIEEVKP